MGQLITGFIVFLCVYRTYFFTPFNVAGNAPKIRIKVRAFDHKVIDFTVKKIIDTATQTGAIVAGPIPLPTDIERVTVLRSTFVHKDAREQFERKTHKRLIDITETNPKTVDALTNLSLPSGVGIAIEMI